MYLLLLHEIFPDFGPIAGFVQVVGLIGVLSVPVAWVRRMRNKTAPWYELPEVPPILRIAIVVAIVSGVILGAIESLSEIPMVGMLVQFYMWMGFPFAFIAFPFVGDQEMAAVWFGDTMLWSGVATAVWWAWSPFRRKNRKQPPPVEVILESEVRSEQDACEQCRAVAQAGMGEPLVRVGHSADGPKFLYRCSSCHSYWRKDMTEMRPVSVVRARQEFPNAVT